MSPSDSLKWQSIPPEGLSFRPAKAISFICRFLFLEVHNRFVGCFKRKHKGWGMAPSLNNPHMLAKKHPEIDPLFFLPFFFKGISTWLHYFNVTRKQMGSQTIRSTYNIHKWLMNSSRSVSHNDLANLTPIYFCVNLTIDFPVVWCGPPQKLVSNRARC